jgi:hypothetical protein
MKNVWWFILAVAVVAWWTLPDGDEKPHPNEIEAELADRNKLGSSFPRYKARAYCSGLSNIALQGVSSLRCEAA